MTNNNDCLFCKILDGKIPSSNIFENDKVLGFKDIHPQAPVHYLFIPKKHYSSLADVPTAEISVMGDLFKAIQEVTVRDGISSRGYKTVIHTGKGGGQIVFHLHVHLMAQV